MRFATLDFSPSYNVLAMSIESSEKVSRIVRFLNAKGAAKPVLFVGSGASIDAGLPSWNELTTRLAELTNRNTTDQTLSSPLDLADLAQQENPAEYRHALWSAFRNERREPGVLDECLGSLRRFIQFVVTPNFDKLLETAFRINRLGVDPPVVTRIEDATRLVRNGEFFVFKIHGDIDQPDSVVLSKSQYATVEHEKIFEFLLSAFRVLFVGYGFRDPILEHFLQRAMIRDKYAFESVLLLISDKEAANVARDRRLRPVTFRTFEEQKDILRDVSSSIVETPFGQVRDICLRPDPALLQDPIFQRLSTRIPRASGRILVLYENWEYGWDADDFQYRRQGTQSIPQEALPIVSNFAHEVDKPWLGKLAANGIIEPVLDRPGTIRVNGTTYEKYRVLWLHLDKELPSGQTPREVWWQSDVLRKFEESALPHICCCHIIIVSSDQQLLLTRKSRHSDFAKLNWCPSIEEQAADGPGDDPRAKSSVDASPRATVERGLSEELGIPADWIDELRFHALCVDWVYSDCPIICSVRLNRIAAEVSFSIVASRDRAEFERSVTTRIQHDWTPAGVDNVARLFKTRSYGSDDRIGDWHPSAQLRLFALMVSMVRWGWATWPSWREELTSAPNAR